MCSRAMKCFSRILLAAVAAMLAFVPSAVTGIDITCATMCACYTLHDVPECESICHTDPIDGGFVAIVPNGMNPALKNDSQNCPKGYAPTPTVNPLPQRQAPSFAAASASSSASSRKAARHHHRVHKEHDPPVAAGPASSVADPLPLGVKPNVILFLMDDQDSLNSPFFEAMPFSSSFFASAGVNFDSAFTSSSICCAARCQLLTGLYGHNVGVTGNAGEFGGFDAFSRPKHWATGDRIMDDEGRCWNNEERNIALILQNYGNYYTGLIGKYLNGLENDANLTISHVTPGFDEFIVNTDHNFYEGYNYTLGKYQRSRGEYIQHWRYGTREEDYSTDVIGEHTLEFLNNVQILNAEHAKRNEDPQPFFLYVAATAPHLPLMAAKRHYNWTQYWWDRFQSDIIDNRPRKNYYYQADMSTKPEFLQVSLKTRDQVNNWNWNQMDYAKRMGSLYALDEMIQSVVEETKSLGLFEKTIFLLVSDNGYNLGAHHLIHKMAPYEESIRIPMYFAAPGFPTLFQQSVTQTEQAALIDIAPTLLELAGLQPPPSMDGRSLLPWLLTGTPPSPPRTRTVLLLHYGSYGLLEAAPTVLNPILAEFPPLLLVESPFGFFDDLLPYVALRREDYLLVEWHTQVGNLTYTLRDRVQWEIYDMKNDPLQITNIYWTADDKQKNHDLWTELKTQMDIMLHCSGANCVV